MNPQKKRKMFLIGGIALAVLAAAVVLIFVLGGIGGGDEKDAYRTHYTAARAAYLAGDYDEALAELSAALKIEETTEALKLQVEILELRQQVHGDRENSGGDDGDGAGAVTVGGQRFAADTVSVVLSGKDLGNEDLAALCSLTELENLIVANNHISDLRPVAALSKLKTLYLDGNPVTDLTPLYGLKSLRTLSIADITIGAEARSALAEALPDCEIFPAAEETPEKITLGGMTFTTEVTELNLSDRGITDLSALAGCKDLVKLDLRDNNITDLSPLLELQKLEWLCLWNNDVEDVTPLMGLTKLKYLDLDANSVEDITALGYLTGLTELWLNGNPLRSLSPLTKLTGLERLGLKNTGMTDTRLSVLLGLENLKELSLDDNQAVSGETLRLLQEALPNCRITPEPAPEPEETAEPEETEQPEETPEPGETPEPEGEEAPETAE